MNISIRTAAGRWILAACILASGIGFLMSSAVNIALPSIQRVFSIEIGSVQWIANSYLLALSSLILVSGSLADLFGVRRIFTAGIGIFTAGALLCGLAAGPVTLIWFRGVQGIGAALMVPSSLAVINSRFPDSEKGRAIGLWAGISGAIAALGPFVGGFLADLNWRLVFLAMTPLGIATFVTALRFIPESPRQEPAGRGSRIGELDWPGIVLVIGGLGGLSFGLIRMPNRGAAPLAVSLAAAGALALLFFFLQQRRSPHPLVPPKLFNRTVLGANLATLVLYLSFEGAFFLLSFNLQQLQGMSPTKAGLAFLPTTILIALLAGPSGSITDRFGPRPQMIAGPLLVAAGFALLLPTGRDTPYMPLFFLSTSIIGIGMAVVIPAITSAALSVPPRRSGAASGVNNAAARVAQLLAIVIVGGVLGGVFTAALSARLDGNRVTAEEKAEILEQSGQLLELELPGSLDPGTADRVRANLEEAYLLAFRIAVALILLLAASAAVLGAFLIRGGKRTEAPEEP